MKKSIMKITVVVGIIMLILLGVTLALTSITATGTKRQVINAGDLDLILDEDAAINLTNAMPVYDEVGMIGDPFNFRLINKTPTSLVYTLKLVKASTSNELSPEIVRYGLTKDGETAIDFLSTITDDIVDSGTISGNQTIEYSLRLWIDINVEDESLINGKTLSYRVDVEASEDTSSSEEHPIGEVKELAFSEENLGENCKTYNDGTDTFLVGQCSQNYVWYSGKLWRVVLKNNETSAVKMVTNNSMTMIPYNESEKPEFEGSYADQWLQQEFLPTLHDFEKYLVVDSIWDAALDASSKPVRPNKTTTFKRTIGMLNAYEYSSATVNGYLTGSKYYWWLITPYNATKLCEASINTLSNDYTYRAAGIRPAINLQPSVQIISGDGTETNPYKLVGDKQAIRNGMTLLSTRYSGEYVRFNNQLYRIVNVENNLTKITLVEEPESSLKLAFHSVAKVTNFENADIKKDLEEYYNELNSIDKSMIETDTTWYLGAVQLNKYNYKLTACNLPEVDVSVRDCEKTTSIATANIGLPRLGEIFTSHISRSERASGTTFWTLTPENYYNSVWNIGDLAGNSYSVLSKILVRPSLYLKEKVVISKDNTGDGTYEHPYDIELGA